MQTPARKDYRAPALKVYGDLRTLTQQVPTNNNKNDPGNSSQTKT
jgi:hypothetical protein